MLLKAPPTDKDRPKQTKTVGSPNGPVTFPNELLAFCKYVYIQPGKHKDGDGTVEQQEKEREEDEDDLEENFNDLVKQLL